MRNLIIIISVVFIAVIALSYLYFSNLKRMPSGDHPPDPHMDVLADNESQEPQHAPVWTFELNADPIGKPAVFWLNHTQRFILLQDAYHILYAVSDDGEKLWNAQLSGEIVGSIHQLADSSLVFTTPERLYRIDKDGDPFRGFSLRLTQRATGIGAYPIEDKQHIRIDVQTGDRIHTYDGTGKRLQTRNYHREDTLYANRDDETTLRGSTDRFTVVCDSLFYVGPLRDDEEDYLLCGNQHTLYCYRAE